MSPFVSAVNYVYQYLNLTYLSSMYVIVCMMETFISSFM